MNLKVITLFIITIMLSLTVSACNKQKEGNTSDLQSKQTSFVEVNHISKEEFLEKIFNYEKNSEWIYAGERPCIIDFYATWCGPCKKVSPILNNLAGEYKGKIDFYKVDVDKEKELAAAFGVSSIPTFLFIPKEGNPYIFTGALNREQFIETINQYLLK